MIDSHISTLQDEQIEEARTQKQHLELHESLEKEKISEDKRDTLYKLLESLKGSSEDNGGSKNFLNDNRYGRIYRF